MKLVLAWLVLLSAPVMAATPPSAFIIKSLAAKHLGVKGVRLRSIVTLMDGDKATSVHFKAVTYFNPQTLTLRSYALDDEGRKLYGVERKSDSATPADALLFWPASKAMANHLKAAGVPIRTEDELGAMTSEEERRGFERTRLARLSSSVAWVTGGTKSDEPQLWVEKDTFLPLRLVAQVDGTVADLRFEGQRYYHEFPYPRMITAAKAGSAPVLHDEVQELALVLDTAEFKAPMRAGYTDAGNSASGAVRDLIRSYYELVR